ncbi:hypothetical protein [Evansella tamaricis]|uniref:Uncharacterized protein n=1 Tax=Evansella tamaricis TaxID=2069301 RepID=A0ABS6JFB3_9BACI|nr:hypothetical protein [Evansella tamaricis]MBU9712326.1 hypothetical protein [Evansella tamaricis]
MSMKIKVGEININSQSDNSGVYIGSNNIPGCDSQTKNTMGNGSFSGSNISFNNFNSVNSATGAKPRN